VPITTPGAVASRPGSLAIPKSASRAAPRASNRTFAGFTSRCTRPRACAAPNASATSAPTRAASAGGSGPAARRSASEPPSQYAMAMYGRPPSASPTSWTGATCGWSRPAAARASTTKRARDAASAASPQSSRRNLSATGRSRRSSWASHTVAMPPAPSRRTSRYGPTRVPASNAAPGPGPRAGGASARPTRRKSPASASAPSSATSSRASSGASRAMAASRSARGVAGSAASSPKSVGRDG
jgi:hypothetical protein